ncbi:MAG: 23S rRNA (pseudouridine(1915)-N(3))-methyltransferase RlmH [Lachnospiraceae bacterium]|nr:23S rRNA (pseudouridine(1915)-N(3))-methyltransferase RlmH [Lachnospiraceae bacterium]
MRGITLLCVGRMKEPYLREASAEYVKRLTPYMKTEIAEVADERAPETLSAAEVRKVLQREGERILQRIPEKAYVIALAIEGNERDSLSFARHMRSLQEAHERIVFVIGGSNGLSEEVLARADEAFSFSRLTFPHQLMRVVLLEQIYRSFKINHGEPYHK